MTERRIGIGRAPCHHGELLQGSFLIDGVQHRGLVTLRCPDRNSTATITLDAKPGEVTVCPPWKTKALKAARLAFMHCGINNARATLSIQCDVPVGYGFGSSTSDVVATIRAVGDAVGQVFDAGRTARLAVVAESASDSVMIEDAVVLFAQRAGRVLRKLGDELPALDVIGFPTRGVDSCVSTLSLPAPEYTHHELEVFAQLLQSLHRGIAIGSAALVGQVATESSRINQRLLPVDIFDQIEDIAVTSGAVGVQIAHSGSIAGLLYDAAADPAEAAEKGRRMLREAGLQTWQFSVGGGAQR